MDNLDEIEFDPDEIEIDDDEVGEEEAEVEAEINATEDNIETKFRYIRIIDEVDEWDSFD